MRSAVSPRESIVQISIVVPHQGDLVAFEETLVSVLENRPAAAEVLVAHDGTYQDPFDLSDEVRFVVAGSNQLVSLIAAAAEVAAAPCVHVIAGGVRATAGWTDAALAAFDDPTVAMVVPTVRHSESGPIVAAGWRDASVDVLTAVAAGARDVSRQDLAAVRGPYLNASFWSRNELRAACRACSLADAVAAEFAWPRLLADAGWNCRLATDAVLLGSEANLIRPQSFHAAKTLRSLQSEIDQSSGYGAVLKAGLATLLHPGRLLAPARWGQWLGQASSLLGETAAVRSIRYDQIGAPDDAAAPAGTVAMPQPAASWHRQAA